MEDLPTVVEVKFARFEATKGLLDGVNADIPTSVLVPVDFDSGDDVGVDVDVDVPVLPLKAAVETVLDVPGLTLFASAIISAAAAPFKNSPRGVYDLISKAFNHLQKVWKSTPLDVDDEMKHMTLNAVSTASSVDG